MKRICASVAVSGFGLSVWSSFIAFSPAGVAALSSPSMLAAMFMTIAPKAGWSGGTDGKIRTSSGRTRRESSCTAPPASPTFIRPRKNASIPVRPIEISKAVLAMLKEAVTISPKTPALPAKTSCPRAKRMPRKKNESQMTFRTMPEI